MAVHRILLGRNKRFKNAQGYRCSGGWAIYRRDGRYKLSLGRQYKSEDYRCAAVTKEGRNNIMGWAEQIKEKREQRKRDAVLKACMRYLGVKRFQKFCFRNQKDKKNRYFFSNTMLVKQYGNGAVRESYIKLNYLLDLAKDLIIVTDEYAEEWM